MPSREDPLEPDQLLHFVELDEFGADWERLGLDVESDLLALQHALMLNPMAGDLVPGTGGLRKLRFSPPALEQGQTRRFAGLLCAFPRVLDNPAIDGLCQRSAVESDSRREAGNSQVSRAK